LKLHSLSILLLNTITYPTTDPTDQEKCSLKYQLRVQWSKIFEQF